MTIGGEDLRPGDTVRIDLFDSEGRWHPKDADRWSGELGRVRTIATPYALYPGRAPLALTRMVQVDVGGIVRWFTEWEVDCVESR